jgi:hypothetical protein
MFFSKGKTETYAGDFVDQKLVRGGFAVSAHGQKKYEQYKIPQDLQIKAIFPTEPPPNPPTRQPANPHRLPKRRHSM